MYGTKLIPEGMCVYAISSTKQIYRYFLERLFDHNIIDSANSVILGRGYLFI